MLSIKSDSDSFDVVEHETVTLTCSANCFPICHYTWSIGATVLNESGSLTLLNVLRNTTDTYICTATHTRGYSASMNTSLVVKCKSVKCQFLL